MASAVRSPVPIAPQTGTGTDRPPLIASVSASSAPGSTPEPPAAIWLTRTTSMARPSSAAISGPPPPAWLRTSRRPWAATSPLPTARPRFAPTPVVRP